MQWETTLFRLGEEPGNINEIPYSELLPASLAAIISWCWILYTENTSLLVGYDMPAYLARKEILHSR